jgi:hypothetical protein
MFIKKGVQHLKENNMSYWQHLVFASIHGLRCVVAGILLLCHSVVPGLFPKIGSSLVNRLNQSFIEHNEYLKSQKDNNV